MKEKKKSKEKFKNRYRLAAALRTLYAEIVTCDAPDEIFHEIAVTTESFVKKLEKYPRRVRVIAEKLEDEIRIEDNRINYGDLIHFSPMSGPANPIAPPMTVFKEDDSTIGGRVTFSAAYEGGPGLVHGGAIASAFDEILGITQSLSGMGGMTGILKVRYRNPCPLQTELRMKGRIHQIVDRRIVARATLHNKDVLVADGEATFIVLDSDQFKEKCAEQA